MKFGRGQLGLAVALLCTAAATPLPVSGAEVAGAERELRQLDEQITFVEKEYTRHDETSAARARRKFSQGEIQILLEDWSHAAGLLYEAMEDPELVQSADYPAALFYLGEALNHLGARSSAQNYFKRALAYPQAPHYGEAFVRALDGAIRLGAPGEAEALVARAAAAYAQPPSEVLYLSAKALYRRRDLPPAERMRRTLEALAAVRRPFHLAAAYLKGALLIQAGDLPSAAEAFRECAEQEPQDARQREQRELCELALARTYADLGRYGDAFDRYQGIPRDSPRFDESLLEVASTYVRAKNYEQALHTAVLVPELAPGTPLAPEAALLQGHLYLRLGRYANALETYNQVIDQYAPIRDEIAAMLALHDDKARYFDELVRSGNASDVSSMLPPLAVKWASARADVAGGLQMVAALDQGKLDLDRGEGIALRVGAVLSRGDGLDAFPHLQEGYARAEGVENAGLKLQARIISRETELLASGLDGTGKADLAGFQGARAELEERVRGLPASPAEVEERMKRFRGRLAEVERSGFQVGFLVESCQAALSATQLWVDRHRSEIRSNAQGNTDFVAEMRKHHEVVAAYREELRELQREILEAEDATGGPGLTAGEVALRGLYRRLLEAEWKLLASGRDALDPSARREADHLDELRQRVAALDSRAEAVKQDLLARAQAGIDLLRRRLAAERQALGAELASLAGLQGDARNVVGRMAQHSFEGVRAQFYRLVLKADLGILDVAWQRKRERLEKIQQLSATKAADLAGLDEEFQGVMREVQ